MTPTARSIGRKAWSTAALAMPAACNPASGAPKTGTAPTGATMTATATTRAGGKDAIRPFRVEFSDASLADMKRRILAMRWPPKELVADQSQGVQLATLQKLARA